MKYYLITGRTPERSYVPAREYRPAQPFVPPVYGKDEGGNLFLITPAIPAHPEVPAAPESPAVPAQDIRIMIGETNPFQTNGKPFLLTKHMDFGIQNLDQWKRLIAIYGERITHEYFVTKEGLRQHLGSESIPAAEPVPAYHLFALLNDGFVKEGKTEGGLQKIVYWKQKGRIEDEDGKTYTADEMIRILEDR